MNNLIDAAIDQYISHELAVLRSAESNLSSVMNSDNADANLLERSLAGLRARLESLESVLNELESSTTDEQYAEALAA
jgi:hypothetical protein